MSNEVSINSMLRVNDVGATTHLVYNGVGPPSFNDDISSRKGPAPGAMDCPTTWTTIDLSQLDTPGWCEVYNQGTQYTIEISLYDPELQLRYLLFTVAPGKKIGPFKLHGNFGYQYGPGTGSGQTTAVLQARGVGGTGHLYFGGFEA